MKYSTSLKIAAGWIGFIAVGHSIGHFFPSDRGLQEQIVLKALKGYEFSLMGFQRTHWDFYRGGSLAISLTLIFQVALLLVLAKPQHEKNSLTKPLLSVFLVCNTLFAILYQMYFFVVPAASALIASVFIFLALKRLKTQA